MVEYTDKEKLKTGDMRELGVYVVLIIGKD